MTQDLGKISLTAEIKSENARQVFQAVKNLAKGQDNCVRGV
jgi:hypothetical protein